MIGKIILGCGHECSIRPHGFPFMLKSEECDPVSGFYPAVAYHSWCRDCYVRALKEYPEELLFDEVEVEEYFAEWRK